MDSDDVEIVYSDFSVEESIIDRYVSEIASDLLEKIAFDPVANQGYFLASARYFLAESSTPFYYLQSPSFHVICLRNPHVYNLVYLLRRTINTVLICSC
jgi:hypothetical protein